MTKLLEQAIAKVRELPAEDQDTLAVVLLSMASDGSAIPPLDEETRAASGRAWARRVEGNLPPTKRLRRSGTVTDYESALHAARSRRS